MPWRTVVAVVGIAVTATSRSGAEPGVRPVGAYSLALAGFSSNPDTKPQALLWCQGASLLGVVLPEGSKNTDCGSASQKRSAATALLLRDGRCEPDGRMSFGFLVSRKAWVFAATGRVPEERTVWLLHRFEGSLKAGVLTGTSVQVDVSHPGYPFQRKPVQSEMSVGQQQPFADGTSWRAWAERAYCVASGEP